MKKQILLAIFLFISISIVKAQNNSKPVSLSVKIGTVIDQNEKLQYHIFPYLSSKTFYQASIFQNADGSYFINETLINGDHDTRAVSKEEFNALVSEISEAEVKQNVVIEKSIAIDVDKPKKSPKSRIYAIAGLGVTSGFIAQDDYFKRSGGSNEYFNLGDGSNSILGIGIQKSDLISFELNAIHFSGNEESIGSNNVYDPRRFSIQADIYKINPSIKIGFKYYRLKPYLKTGPILSFSPTIEINYSGEYEYDYNHNSYITGTKFIEKGGISPGWFTALGFTLSLNEYLEIFSEINSTLLYHTTEKRTATYYYQNRTSSTSDIDLKDSPDMNDPKVDFKNSLNLSRIGFNFGINIYFKP